MEFIGMIIFNLRRIPMYFIKKYQKSIFKKCGNNVWLGNNCTFTYKNISLGDDVSIGANACMQSAHGKIIIGNHVIVEPGQVIYMAGIMIFMLSVYAVATSRKLKPRWDDETIKRHKEILHERGISCAK